MLIGAVECLEGGQSGRIRLSQIQDYTGETLKGFAEQVTAGRSTIITDGLSSYQGVDGRNHLPKIVGSMAAHIVLPWIYRVFANLKRLVRSSRRFRAA